MERIIFFLLIIIIYLETYLLLAPVQDWSRPKKFALYALDSAPPPLGKNMTALKTCVERANVKHVGYVSRNTTAYVTIFRRWALEDIYVTVLTDFLGDEERALTLIHECTHLVWCSVDLAYYGEDAFWTLTPDEESMNADSLVEIFSPYVYEAELLERTGWRPRTPKELPTTVKSVPERGSPLLRKPAV